MQSELLVRAFEFATTAHADQKRKGSKEKTPYVSHLWSVAAMAVEFGGNEETVAAAFLHDVVEDIDGISIETIREEFGHSIAQIVASLTEDKSLPWETRKESALRHIPRLSDEAFIVKCSDALYNSQGLLLDFSIIDWSSFKRSARVTTLQYSRLILALNLEAKNRTHLSETMRYRLRKTSQQLYNLCEILET